MFKKLAAAAAVSMAMVAPAMADAGFEAGTGGWWWQTGTTQLDQMAYGSSVNVDWFGAPQAVVVDAATNAIPEGAGSYFGLLSKGSTFGAQADHFGGSSVAGDKLWLSILSGDNASGLGYTGLSVLDGGDWAYVTFYGNGGNVLGTPDAVTTGMACGGAACTIENNWFYYDVPVGTVGYVVTLRQGDETNVAKLAIDYTSAAAVPEPETYALMLAGLGAVGFMARRRSKAA